MGIFDKKRMSVYEPEPDDLQIPAAPYEEMNVKKEIPQSKPQMKLVRPKKLGEAIDVANSLKNGQTIVLNLEDLSDAHARRLLDYVAGVIYAVNGKIERPSERTFLLTPKGIHVDTEENK